MLRSCLQHKYCDIAMSLSRSHPVVTLQHQQSTVETRKLRGIFQEAFYFALSYCKSLFCFLPGVALDFFKVGCESPSLNQPRSGIGLKLLNLLNKQLLKTRAPKHWYYQILNKLERKGSKYIFIPNCRCYTKWFCITGHMHKMQRLSSQQPSFLSN